MESHNHLSFIEPYQGAATGVGGILRDKIDPTLLPILLALYMFGIGKAALMPFHRWLPSAMVAPTPVSALLHAVAVVKARGAVAPVVKAAAGRFPTSTKCCAGRRNASVPCCRAAAVAPRGSY